MSIWRLVLCEIRFRKLNFSVGVLAVAVAVACLVGQITLLAAKERDTARKMAKLEDDMRIITKNLGFNISILPRDLNLLDFYGTNYADKFMPEEYADRLANARIVTIAHLLPTLQQKVRWPEQDNQPILLCGTRGEVPILDQSKKKPILDAVPKDKIVLGFQLHRLLSRVGNKEIAEGDAVTLLGRTFQVYKLQPSRGNLDDITAWVALSQAQEMLGKSGLITGMLALGCNCAADRLSIIRAEIAKVLPDTQVEEFETKATVRAEARAKAAEEAKAALQREHDFAAVVGPIVLLGCAVWLSVMALLNVFQRRGEIGLLRAVGFRSSQLLGLFLARAMLVGFLGALVGYLLGASAGMLLGDESVWLASSLYPQLMLLAAVLIVAPLVSALACWLPSLVAVRQDPALVLQQEAS